MAKYDELLKKLGRLCPADFVRWCCPQVQTISEISFKDREFEITHRRVDLLYRINSQELGVFYLLLEFETGSNPNFSHRMHEYFALIWKDLDAPLKPVAVFLNITPTVQAIPQEIECMLGEERICTFRYEKILLPEESWNSLVEKRLPALLPLVSITRIPEGEEEKALRQTVGEIEKIEDQKLRSKILAVFYLLAGYRYQKAIKTILGDKLMKDLMESATYRETTEIGEKRGELRGERTSICAVLEARFNIVPPSLAQELEEVNSIEHLKHLVKTAATVRSLMEFQTALTQARQQKEKTV